MNLPQPKLVDGRPVVVGSMVHAVALKPVSRVRICVACFVTGPGFAEDVFAMRSIEDGETFLLQHDVAGEPGTWHWPVVDRPECQGIAK